MSVKKRKRKTIQTNKFDIPEQEFEKAAKATTSGHLCRIGHRHDLCGDRDTRVVKASNRGEQSRTISEMSPSISGPHQSCLGRTATFPITENGDCNIGPFSQNKGDSHPDNTKVQKNVCKQVQRHPPTREAIAHFSSVERSLRSAENI
jgi:hypothetical protein